MSETKGDKGGNRLLAPRKIALQLFGFAIGIGLLVWIIRGAIRGGDWGRIADASPWLIVGLVGCSLVSVLVNGVIFWLVIQPVRRLGLLDLQLLNLVTAVLNYAPIRAGVIARIAYHLRVDRLGLLQVGAWLAAIAYTMALALGACITATLVRPRIDLFWLAIVVAIIGLGGLLTIALVSQPLVVRYGRGLDLMLRDPTCLWGSLGLRLVDIAAFTGRMACATAILQLPFSGSDIALLAVATLALSLNPLGRFGFREAGVAVVGRMLISSDAGAADLTGQIDQLALIDSAGEAIVFIPLGLIALVWYRRKWREAGEEEVDQAPGN